MSALSEGEPTPMGEGGAVRKGLGDRTSRVLGELTLIFLGITAALWFDNVNEARRQRALETQILREMSTALSRDTVDLHINVVLSDSVLASIDTLLAALDAPAAYRDELAGHFAWSSRFFRFFNNPAAYEHLRSAGFDVISNDVLRQSIISYYDASVSTLRWVEETMVLENWESYVLPQMMAKFEYGERGLPVVGTSFAPTVPRDYVALRSDTDYQNALRARVGLIEGQRALTLTTLSEAEALSREIMQALVGR